MENWLYDDGAETANKSMFISKLDELKKFGEPCAERLRGSFLNMCYAHTHIKLNTHICIYMFIICIRMERIPQLLSCTPAEDLNVRIYHIYCLPNSPPTISSVEVSERENVQRRRSDLRPTRSWRKLSLIMATWLPVLMLPMSI